MSEQRMKGIMIYIDEREELAILSNDEFREIINMMLDWAEGKEPKSKNRIVMGHFLRVKKRLVVDQGKYVARKVAGKKANKIRWDNHRERELSADIFKPIDENIDNE